MAVWRIRPHPLSLFQVCLCCWLPGDYSRSEWLQTLPGQNKKIFNNSRIIQYLQQGILGKCCNDMSAPVILGNVVPWKTGSKPQSPNPGNVHDFSDTVFSGCSPVFSGFSLPSPSMLSNFAKREAAMHSNLSHTLHCNAYLVFGVACSTKFNSVILAFAPS